MRAFRKGSRNGECLPCRGVSDEEGTVQYHIVRIHWEAEVQYLIEVLFGAAVVDVH